MYNDSEHVTQYCNGSQWVAMGPVGDAAIGVSKAGLVGHWKFDETSGTTATDSAGSNDGTMQAGLSATNDAVAGTMLGALNLDGTDDYIRLTASPDTRPLP